MQPFNAESPAVVSYPCNDTKWLDRNATRGAGDHARGIRHPSRLTCVAFACWPIYTTRTSTHLDCEIRADLYPRLREAHFDERLACPILGENRLQDLLSLYIYRYRRYSYSRDWETLAILAGSAMSVRTGALWAPAGFLSNYNGGSFCRKCFLDFPFVAFPLVKLSTKRLSNHQKPRCLVFSACVGGTECPSRFEQGNVQMASAVDITECVLVFLQAKGHDSIFVNC